MVTFGAVDATEPLSPPFGRQDEASAAAAAAGRRVRRVGAESVSPGLGHNVDVVGPEPEPPWCCAVGVFNGPEVAAEVRSEVSPSVLLWLLQELGSFSPGARLTPCGFRVVSAFQDFQEGESGREEARRGVMEPDMGG